MGENTAYAQQDFNTVNRYKHQAKYDASTIHSIVNTTPVLHISFAPSISDLHPFPTILPMIGQIGLYPPDEAAGSPDPKCYIHGYVSARLMNLASSSNNEGLPVCVSATKVDGFVLSLTPYSHNYNYRSAVLHGYATIVEDEDEKMWAMQMITDSVVPGRWEGSRVPPRGSELASTRILKVKIEGASAKVRVGVPEDDRADMKNEDILNSVWTGVIPVHEQLGAPVPGPYNRVQETPKYIDTFVRDENAGREEYATGAAVLPAPSKKAKKTEE